MALISDSKEWSSLVQHATEIKSLHLRDLMQDASRCAALTAGDESTGKGNNMGIYLDYSRENVTVQTMEKLYDLAKAANLEEKCAAMFEGKHINNTEDRAVLHTALRAPADHKPILVDGKDVLPDVHRVLSNIKDFVTNVRNGTWLGCTGKTIHTVLSVGIGGSYLGPEFVYEALRTHPDAATAATGRTLRFLANVDPVDAERSLSGLDPERTLVVIVSKTFTTTETMVNARTVKNWLLKHLCGRPASPDINAQQFVTEETAVRQHMAAVSTAVSLATNFGISSSNIFGFWDWVGGRYSVCSAVGVLPLALHYDYPCIQEFLEGAHLMDVHFKEAPIASNLPMLLGLLGIWNASFMGYPSRALLPYSQALLRFPAHIQQVDMESNGKRTSTHGDVLPYATGEVIIGEPGTNGQHSLYQLIHQGQIIPAEFIGFCKTCGTAAASFASNDGVTSHDELMSNFFAQVCIQILSDE